MSFSERVTITLPAVVLESIDKLERNRSRFIAEAVRRELKRRLRASLVLSLKNPHPESEEFERLGLHAWKLAQTSPDESDLLDTSKGTAVRWRENQGWEKI
jgi:hypothetical protein